jgi:hypothetical protein
MIGVSPLSLVGINFFIPFYFWNYSSGYPDFSCSFFQNIELVVWERVEQNWHHLFVSLVVMGKLMALRIKMIIYYTLFFIPYFFNLGFINVRGSMNYMYNIHFLEEKV